MEYVRRIRDLMAGDSAPPLKPRAETISFFANLPVFLGISTGQGG